MKKILQKISYKNINKFSKVIAGIVFAWLFVAVPLVTEAAGGGAGPIVPTCSGLGNVSAACNYQNLIQLGINVMNFAIYLMAMLSVISFVYAGWLYISSGGSDGQIKKAHEVFTKVALGIFFTMGAWLVVHQISVWLGVKGDFTLLQ